MYSFRWLWLKRPIWIIHIKGLYNIELGYYSVCWPRGHSSPFFTSALLFCSLSNRESHVTKFMPSCSFDKFPVHPAEAHKALTSCTSLLAVLVQEWVRIWTYHLSRQMLYFLHCSHSTGSAESSTLSQESGHREGDRLNLAVDIWAWNATAVGFVSQHFSTSFKNGCTGGRAGVIKHNLNILHSCQPFEQST